jgi:hypothetical protein
MICVRSYILCRILSRVILLIRNDSRLLAAAPCDMICDMVSKPTGRPRGRPTGIARDPDRYLLSYLLAQRMRPSTAKLSERKLTVAIIAVSKGRRLDRRPLWAERGPSVKIIEGAPRGKKRPDHWILFEDDKNKHLGDVNGIRVRDESVFHAAADNLTRKLRKFLRRHDDLEDGSEDSKWVLAMTNAWLRVLEGTNKSAFVEAEFFVKSIGEEQYFKSQMAPIHFARAGRLPSPPLIVPDFSPLISVKKFV